jgi:hypothetical protein
LAVAERFSLLKQGLKLLSRQRPTEQIALVFGASRMQEKLPLLLRLHPFGNDVQVQAFQRDQQDFLHPGVVEHWQFGPYRWYGGVL